MSTPSATTPADDLITLRDWLRYAVSRFAEAKVEFGQGTETALDEAAFLILWALHLPIDTFDPFADARLTRPEREKLLALIEARITTRKPAAYLTGEAWIKGNRFIVDERVIVPRSYIGEFLAGDGPPPFGAPGIGRVLDLCTGSGCLAILAALAYPDATVDAVDLSGDALKVAQVNVADYGLGSQVRLLQGDLFAPLGDARYDLIICNPPYVSDEIIARYPVEHGWEPHIAHAGGPDGLAIVRRILAEAGSHLLPGGELVMEVGLGQALIASEYPQVPFVWLETEDSQGDVLLLAAEGLAPMRRAKRRRK